MPAIVDRIKSVPPVAWVIGGGILLALFVLGSRGSNSGGGILGADGGGSSGGGGDGGGVDYSEDIADLQGQIGTLTTETGATIAGLEAALAEAQADDILFRTDILGQLNDNSAATQAQITGLQGQIADLISSGSADRGLIDVLQANLAKLTNLNSLQDQLTKALIQREALNRKITDARLLFRTGKITAAERDRRVQEAEKALATLATAITSLQAQIKAITG